MDVLYIGEINSLEVLCYFNSVVKPNVSGPVMIREDLHKPIKDAISHRFGQYVRVCQHKYFLPSFHSRLLLHRPPTPSFPLRLTNVSL